MRRCFRHHGRVIERDVHMGEDRAARRKALDPESACSIDRCSVESEMQAIDDQRIEALELVTRGLRKIADVAAIGRSLPRGSRAT